MANYVLDPIGVVENLRSLLRDQYEPKSIFKELVQNADDAASNEEKTTVLHLAQHIGWPDHSNPLLQVPALLVLNDGPFLPKDASAFNKIGIGSKSGDELAIGKFGRGLKSIFHVCEAFFYFGSEDQPGFREPQYAEQPNAGLLNPWEGTGYHPSWRCDANALSRLREVVYSWSHGCRSWFCLWIPLKCPRLLAGTAPIVQPSSCSIDDIVAEDFARRSAELLPLLRNLQTISHWRNLEAPHLTVSIDKSAVRRQYPVEVMGKHVWNPTGLTGKIQGRIYYEQEPDRNGGYLFSGHEYLSEDNLFELMRMREDWPTVSVWMNETGESRQEKDKTRPHAAVVFQQLPAAGVNAGELRVSRNVFLPLTDSERVYPLAGSTVSYRLHLHGCYFVDAGRRDVVLMSDEEPAIDDPHKALAREWNTTLEERVLLPLVLPALQEFVTDNRLSFEQVRALTASLSSAEYLCQNVGALCTRNQWLARSLPHGPEWQLISSNTTYLPLPLPPNELYDLPYLVFPILADLCKEQVLAFPELPILSHESPGSWNQYLETLIQSASLDAFQHSDQLAYFVAFLQTAANGSTRQIIQSCLPDRIREAFRKWGVQVLRRSADSMRDLFALLPTDRLYRLPGSLPSVIHDGLVALNAGPLMIPADLHRGNEASGTFTPTEAATVLAWLDAADISQKLRSDVALDILANTTGQLEEKLERCDGFRLFHLRNMTSEQDVSATWRDVRRLADAGIFVAKNLSLVRNLTSALNEITMYRPTEISNSAIPNILLPDVPERDLYCNADFCVRILDRGPALAVPQNRKPLLRDLLSHLPHAENRDVRRAVRYLLHATVDAYESDDQILYWSSSTGGIWEEVVRRALNVRELGWRLVPLMLGELLSEADSRVLAVAPIDAISAEKLLDDSGVGCLIGWTPDGVTREAILQAIQSNALWREMPLHLTTHGDLIAIRGVHCYLRGAVSPSESLADAVHIIDCAADAPLRQRYVQCGVEVWDARAQIRTALSLPNPSTYCMEILEALAIPGDSLAGDEEMIRELGQADWLFGCDEPVAPNLIIRVDGLDASIDRLLAHRQIKGLFYTLESVDERVRNHRGFATVRDHLLPSTEATITMLARSVSRLPDYSIGEPVIDLPDVEALAQLVIAFGNIDVSHLPGVQSLREMAEQKDLRSHLGPLYRSLRKPLRLPEFRLIFAALKEGYSAETGPYIFNAYFRALVRRPEFSRSDLAGIHLRDGHANWKTADRLCEDFQGIDLADQLRDDLLKILRQEERQHPPSTAQSTSAEPGTPAVDRSLAADVLEQYFRDWRAAGARLEVIGLFLAFISNQDDILALARTYLGERHPIEFLRKRLGWKNLDVGHWGTSELDMELWNTRAQRELSGYGKYYSRAGESQDEAFGSRAFVFLLEDDQAGGHVPVTSLLGEPFRARRSSGSDSLFLGELAFVRHKGQSGVVCAYLRRFDVERMEPGKLHNLLYEASRHILRTVYAQNPNSLSTLFEELAQSEQLDIEVTQQSILRSAFFYFRQLDTKKDHKVSSLAKRWYDLDYEEARECKMTGGSTTQTDRSRGQTLKELKALLEDDAVVQDEVCRAVRGKVEQQQYTVQSVLFELFQNADDAATEKLRMYGTWKDMPNPHLARRVVLQWGQNQLRWINWGRAINQCRGGQLTEQQGISSGYQWDLWKMLVLSASDKDSKNITGKLGLGFKSVLLLTDKPRILSGDLRCEIVAGVFPKRLTGEGADRLARLLDEARESNVREAGTLIDLPLRNEINIEAAISPFLELAHLLPAFAHSLRQIDVIAPDGQKESIVWKRSSLGRGVITGAVHPTRHGKEQGHQATRVLLLRPEKGTQGLLLMLGSRGIASLPDSVPTYWVTLPARGSECGAGVAVNADFEVDPGRAQLANRAENHDAARLLGQRLNTAFASLYDAAQDWDKFATDLSLSNDATVEHFWQSLFLRTVAPFRADTDEQQHHVILRHVLWNQGGGMAEFLSKFPALPTELPGSYARLIRLSDVRRQAAGLLEHKDVFAHVATWARCAAQYPPGQLVSASKVGDPLQRLGVSESIPSMGLLDALNLELPADGRISPSLAAQLGLLLTQEFLNSREAENESESDRKEKTVLRERLRDLRFPSWTGDYVAPRDLLLVQDPTAKSDAEGKEERIRAAFCPDSNRLAKEFVGTGIKFFKACRGEMHAPAEQLVEWGLSVASHDTTRQRAFLDYLLTGELNGKMEMCQERRKRCWIEGLPDSHFREQYSASQWTTLLGKVGFDFNDGMRTGRPPRTPGLSRNIELQKIAEWWLSHRDEQLQRYQSRLYADGGVFLRQLSHQYGRTPQERIAWMTLLLRSSFETMGRAKIEAHKGFLHQHGSDWVRNLVQASSPGEALYDDLCRFVDVRTFNIQFLHWARYYAPVAVFARWLDEYIEVILQLEKVQDHEVKQGLHGFLRVPQNEYLHGSGIDAPSLTPLLGLGIHFLVRELFRTGILTNPVVRPYCYVPSAKIRRLMEACGLPLSTNYEERWEHSVRIHDFVCNALGTDSERFCKDGDIPLQIVASDKSLWERFVGAVEYVDDEDLDWKDFIEAE